jgi:Icc-related predicted phosphoesterase
LPSGYKIPQSQFRTAEFFKPIDQSKEENILSFDLEYYDTDENHSFLLLADPQTQTMADVELFRNESIPDIRNFVADKNRDLIFGVSCGDIMFDDLKLYPEYEKAVEATGLPFFQVFGNHDAETLAKTDEQSISTFTRHFGPNYYSFNRGEIHYVVLDNIFWFGAGYLGYINKEQLDWLSNDLAFVEKGKTVVVFMHIPIYTKIHERVNEKKPGNSVVVTNRQLLYKILESYKSYVICGHMHESEFLNDGGCDIHICGAVSGGWWTGPICHDGTPNGYMVYNANGSSLKWKYKSTGLPFDHQMRLYKNYSFEDKNGLILANVWGYNEKWKLNYYEDGVKAGKFRKINSLDPLDRWNYTAEMKNLKSILGLNRGIMTIFFYLNLRVMLRKLLLRQ